MHIQRITRLLILALICSLPVWLDSCKKEDDAVTSSSIQGNWKITAINMNPSLQGIIADAAAYLKAQGDNCLSDVTLSFKADGNVTYDTPASCKSANSALSISLLESLFKNTKYSETATQVTLSDSSGLQLVTNKTINGNSIQLQWTQDTDLLGGATKTAFTVTMTRV